jgi:hypothetical protein
VNAIAIVFLIIAVFSLAGIIIGMVVVGLGDDDDQLRAFQDPAVAR